jgi:CDP-glucose 4,6-dehydratase
MTGFWSGRPTFVTGGTGLLGGWLVRRLVDAGADVVCLVRERAAQAAPLSDRLGERVRVVRGDVTDQSLLQRVLIEHEIDTVIHLAAQAIVGVANRDPVATLESNVAGTWRLLEACRQSPSVRQILLASSDKAYGDHSALPYTELTPLQGEHPYDVSKSCADLIGRMYAVTYKLPVAITRCGNFYGGGDLNWNRIVPGTIRSIVQGQRPLIRSDGKYVRDYFYVEDGAAAYMLLAERLGDDRALVGEAFNFSHEEPLTVAELVDRLRSLMNSTLEAEITNEARHEILAQWLTAEKARRVLGWRPSFTLDEGLGRTVEWYRSYLQAT